MLTNELQLTVPKRYTRFKSRNHWCKLSILTFRTGASWAHCVGRGAFSCDLCHWHIDQSIKSAKTITSEKRSLVTEIFCWTLWSGLRRGDAIWNWCAPLPRGPHCRRGQEYPKCWLGNGPGWRSPGNQEPLWQPEDKRQALPAAVQVRQAGRGSRDERWGRQGGPVEHYPSQPQAHKLAWGPSLGPCGCSANDPTLNSTPVKRYLPFKKWNIV